MMSRKHGEIIERNLHVLVENTDLDKVVSRLERNQVLNRETIRRILNPSHDVRQQTTNLYRTFMKRGSKTFSKLRNALQESNHADLANLLSRMDAKEENQVNRRPSLNSVGSVDSSGSDLSQAKAETEMERTMLDARGTASSSNFSNDSRLLKLSDYQESLISILSRANLSPNDLVNIRADANRPVNVRPATKWIKPDDFNYKMNSEPRGCALVVNNIKFADACTNPFRKGAVNDQTRLESLLGQFGFDVESHENKTKQEMDEIVRKFTEKKELKKVDCAVIVFMSHGAEGASEEDTEIIGVDGWGLKTKDIIARFNHDNCQALIHKPKVFLFQACRGGLLDHGVEYETHALGSRTESDSQKIISTNRPTRIRSIADVFVAYAVLPGRAANRDIYNGSWFIQTIIDIFAVNACGHDLEDMIKKVDRIIQQLNNADCSNFQTVTTMTIGWSKKLFFNPGLRLDAELKSEAAGDHCLDADRSTGNEEEETECTLTKCLPKTNCNLI